MNLFLHLHWWSSLSFAYLALETYFLEAFILLAVSGWFWTPEPQENFLELQESSTVRDFFDILEFFSIYQSLDIETQSRHGWARADSDLGYNFKAGLKKPSSS